MMYLLEYESFGAACALNEGVFDKYAKDLASSYKKELTALNPMLNEYQKIKRDSMLKRLKINTGMSAETDGAKREKLNNDLVKVNKDEEMKIAVLEKKLAKWASTTTAPVKYLMSSRLEEIELAVMQEEFKKKMSVKGSMTDKYKKRLMDMIKLKQTEINTRAEKLEKMIANQDTQGEDKDIQSNRAKSDKLEADFDASGNVTSQEKQAMKQRSDREKKSPLNKI